MKRIAEIADLALIKAAPELLLDQNKPKGRLKNLLQKLSTAVDNELCKYGTITIDELDKVANAILCFGRKSGWEGKKKHALTITNMCLVIVENHNYPAKLNKLLLSIHDYFEGKDSPRPCYWGASIAAEKWEKIRSTL